MSRPSRDQYFLRIAEVVATRSTCQRRQVGCVLVDKHGHVLATGYNGVPSGMPHCRDNGDTTCPGRGAKSGTNLDKCQAIHAEQNALIQLADANQVDTVYCTVTPCMHCIKMLMNTSAKRLVYINRYPHPTVQAMWEDSGREWVCGKWEDSNAQ